MCLLKKTKILPKENHDKNFEYTHILIFNIELNLIN